MRRRLAARRSRLTAGPWRLVSGPVVCAMCWWAQPVLAQQAPATTENVTLAPIECWTRTSTNAVRVGERFDLVLTCAVVETESTTVVPDQSRLDPGVLQVPPFEVVSGSQAADLRTRTHRLFQYDYVLRYLGEQIGGDLELPGATITYRVQSRVQGDAAVESRDRQYILPSTRIHIASLLPAAANDIHDALPPTFRAVEERRFRASVFRVISWFLLGIGGVMVAWALAALVRRPRPAASTARRGAPETAVLRTVARELEAVRRRREHDGWTSDLAARALAPLRLAASCALGRPVAQALAPGGAVPATGQLRVATGMAGRRHMVVSASATPGMLAQELERAERAGAAVDARLLDLRYALERLGAAAYGRNGAGPESDLDEALTRGSHAVRHVARRYTWPARAARAARQSITEARDRAWAR